MLESDFQESKSNRIEMPDVSEECVKAMLEFIYSMKLTEPFNCSMVAVELFHMAHKYDICLLEEKLAEMLPQRATKWYNVNAAVDLFRFVRNVDKYGSLKKKMIQVLKT